MNRDIRENEGLQALAQLLPNPDDPSDVSEMEGEFTPDEEGNLVLEDYVPEEMDIPHNANLAEYMDDHAISKLSGEIIDGIEDDIDSRKPWLDIIAKSIPYLGTKYEERTTPFQGACGSYSHVLLQSVLTYQAEATTHTFPQGGPAKISAPNDTKKFDPQTIKELEMKASNAEAVMNALFTRLKKDAYLDDNEMNWHVGLEGWAVRKWFIDPIKRIPDFYYIAAKNFIVNAFTKHLNKCSRMTEIEPVSKKDILVRQSTGEYRDVKFALDSASDKDIVTMAEENLVGMSTQNESDDNYGELYVCSVDLDLEGFEDEDEMGERTFIPRPYIVTINRADQVVFSIRRNWLPDDPSFTRNVRYVKRAYVNGPSFLSLGACHILSNQYTSSTALLRQIVDNATLANLPSGIINNKFRFNDNNLILNPGEFKQIETNDQPVSDAIGYLPYRQPSPIMIDIKDKIDNSAMALMGTVNLQLNDITANTPASTMQSWLEESSIPKSNPMRNLHIALQEELEICFRLFQECLPEGETLTIDYLGGSIEVSREDFDERLIVLPVADVTVTSRMQRLLRAQAVMEMAKQNPQLYNMRKVNEAMLQAMKVTNIDEILVQEPQIEPKDPITQNMDLMNGIPVKAFIWEDQQAYIACHQMILNDPNLDPNIRNATIALIHQREAFLYLLTMQEAMGIQLPENIKELSPEQKNYIAQMAAQATQEILAQQQQQQPPQPLDPGVVMLEKVKVDREAVEAKERETTQKNEIEKYKADQKDEVERYKADLKYEAEILREEMKIENSTRETNLKNEVEYLKGIVEAVQTQLQAIVSNHQS